jgi:hypothetical protein
VQKDTLSAIHAELAQALSAAATAEDLGPALDAALEARLLLALADGLMFDAVSAPGMLAPAELEAALDAHLDRLPLADANPARRSDARRA